MSASREFVLVHDMNHGAWCGDDVIARRPSRSSRWIGPALAAALAAVLEKV